MTSEGWSACCALASALKCHPAHSVTASSRRMCYYTPDKPSFFAHSGHLTISAWGTQPPRSGQETSSKEKEKKTWCCPCLQCDTLVLKLCKVPPASGSEVFFVSLWQRFDENGQLWKGGVTISGLHHFALWPRLWNGIKNRSFFSLSFFFFHRLRQFYVHLMGFCS